MTSSSTAPRGRSGTARRRSTSARTMSRRARPGTGPAPTSRGATWLSFEHPPDEALPKAQAAISVEHGIDDRTTVGALARMMLVDDERLTFVEGTVRRSIGQAMVEVGVAGDSSGGKAARAQFLAKFGAVNVSAEVLAANDFHLRGNRASSLRDYRLALDAPLRFGRTVLPAHADVHLTDRLDGTKQLEAAARLSANIDRFNLATDLRYTKQYLRSGPAPPGELNLALIGAGRVGAVRLRGSTSFDVAPQARFRTAELSAYWSASDTVDWEGGPGLRRGHASRAGPGSPMSGGSNSMAIAVTGEAASDGSLALGLNLNFSLDPGGGFKMSRQPLAAAGAVNARVYRDLNDNGVRDPSEPFEKGALVTTGRRLRKADRRQGLGAGRRPRHLHPGDRRHRREQPGRSDAGAAQGAAGGGAAARRPGERRDRAGRRRRHRRRDRQERRPRLRRARPRAGRRRRQAGGQAPKPISTASSCSSACPTATIGSACPRIPRPPRAWRATSTSGRGQRRQVDRPAGLDPRRAAAQDRVARMKRAARITPSERLGQLYRP